MDMNRNNHLILKTGTYKLFHIELKGERNELLPITIGYHATSLENAESILKDGYIIKPSEEMFFGQGMYLSITIEDVIYYKKQWDRTSKGAILEVIIPSHVEWCRINQIEAMGTFDNYLDMMKDSALEELNGQIEDAIIDVDINFPTINLYLEYKYVVDQNILRELDIQFPEIADELLKEGSYEDIISLVKKLKSQKKRKAFYKWAISYGEFEIDEDSLRKMIKRDYYTQSEYWGGCDVVIAPTQIIIHSQDVVNQLKMRILSDIEIEQLLESDK